MFLLRISLFLLHLIIHGYGYNNDIIYNNKCFNIINPDNNNDCILHTLKNRIISPIKKTKNTKTKLEKNRIMKQNEQLHLHPHPLPSDFFNNNKLIMLNIGGVQPSEHWVNVNAQVYY